MKYCLKINGLVNIVKAYIPPSQQKKYCNSIKYKYKNSVSITKQL